MFFIYQPYLSIDENIIDGREISLFQEAVPIKEIPIHNTKAILKELDKIGINYGSIFRDYDSIAKYLKNNNRRN